PPRPGLVRRRQRSALDEPLDVALEGGAPGEHAAAASGADEADVGAQPDDAPGVAAAGMRLPEDDDIVEIEGERSLRATCACRAHGRSLAARIIWRGSAAAAPSPS